MAFERHYLDQLALYMFKKETNYNEQVAWSNTHAVSMLDFDGPSAHEEWDDMVVNNQDVNSGRELITRQELPRHSMRLTYTEPRTKPNTLAGLAGLTLGSVVSTADSVANAYRHRIIPASNAALPSIPVKVKRESGTEWWYTGVKADSYTFSMNEAYWQMQALLVGSGSRSVTSAAFPIPIDEGWLRLGDAKIYLRDTGGTAMTIPAAPSQTTCNLGAGFVDISERVTSLTHTWNNALAVDNAYRAGTGLVRRNPHGQRRTGTVSFGLEMDTALEATEFAYYLNQAKLSLEINLQNNFLLTVGGAFRYGFVLLIPRMQFNPLSRDSQDELELVNFEGNIMDDFVNGPVVWFVYTKQATYLAA